MISSKCIINPLMHMLLCIFSKPACHRWVWESAVGTLEINHFSHLCSGERIWHLKIWSCLLNYIKSIYYIVKKWKQHNKVNFHLYIVTALQIGEDPRQSKSEDESFELSVFISSRDISTKLKKVTSALTRPLIKRLLSKGQ